MPLNILVTGGAGYIGSILVPKLVNEGHNVTVLDNFMFNQVSLNQLCIFNNFNIVNGDIRVKDTILPLLKKADVVIPLAALVRAPLCNKDPIGATSINHDAIKMMLDLLSKNQCVIMPTTNSAYGTGDENNYCTEEAVLKPISQYAKEKVEIEKHLMNIENTISFRLATVFGMSPRMRTDLLVNDFTYKAVHDGSIVLFESHFKRNYIHVHDVARVFLHGISNFSSLKGNIYNVGLSDANISKFELCELIKKQIPSLFIVKSPVGQDPDQRNYVVSNEKIEKTGYKQSVDLETGIKELIKGYKMLKNTQFGNV